MSNTLKAYLALILVTMFWGMTFPLINLAANSTTAYTFVFFRFVLAALIMIPLFIKYMRQKEKKLLFYGFILGLINTVTYTSQTIGLQTLDPASSAFITGLSIIIVPFLAPLFGLHKPTIYDLLFGVICLYGLYLLTGASLGKIVPGVYWTIVCAFFYAVYLVYLQKVTLVIKQHDLLAFYQVMFTGLLAGIYCLPQHNVIHFNSSVIIAIVYCAIFATLIVFILQTRYQRFLPAVQVAMIFALEPIFASFFSYFITNEKFSLQFFAGSGLIFFSIVMAELIRNKKESH